MEDQDNVDAENDDPNLASEYRNMDFGLPRYIPKVPNTKGNNSYMPNFGYTIKEKINHKNNSKLNIPNNRVLQQKQTDHNPPHSKSSHADHAKPRKAITSKST